MTAKRCSSAVTVHPIVIVLEIRKNVGWQYDRESHQKRGQSRLRAVVSQHTFVAIPQITSLSISSFRSQSFRSGVP